MFLPLQPVPEISRRVRALNQQRAAGGLPGVLVHTDAAQALGKRRVDVRDLGVDFLTVVGHKVRPSAFLPSCRGDASMPGRLTCEQSPRPRSSSVTGAPGAHAQRGPGSW